jgi:phage major head subunit gpT-like protein
MATPHISRNFPDVLDPTFLRIFDEEYDQLPDMIPTIYTMPGRGPRGDLTKWSGVGTLPDFTEFTGTIGYQSQSQGYDTTATHLEWANGIQVERKLFDDDEHQVMNQKPAALAMSAQRTRQKHAAQIFNGAFSASNSFYVNSEGVAMCSDSHTTTSGASTSIGFDNKGSAALSAASVSAARTQMRGYRGDQAERISVMPDTLVVPPDLQDRALEIVKSRQDPDSANNAINPQESRFKLIDWEYMSDANNWFMMDSGLQRKCLFWIDRVTKEFGRIEDFDTLVAKFRCYMRYSFAWVDWRFVYGAEVS